MFDPETAKEWNDAVSEVLSRILRQDVSACLRLPSERLAEKCWNNNRTLCGEIEIRSNCNPKNVLRIEKLPFPIDGVFIGASDKHAQSLVWNSWLAEKPGIRFVYPAGKTRREVEKEVELRIGFPDASCVQFSVKLPDGPKGSLLWDEPSDNVCKRLQKLMDDMPFGPLWGGAQDSKELIPEWLKEALNGKAKDVIDAVREHAGELMQPVDQDDLAHRVVVSFPRWLAFRLCKLFAKHKDGDDFFSEEVAKYVPDCLVPLNGLKRGGFVTPVQPNNALELMASITGIKRYHVKRTNVLCFPLDFRQNHPSFRGRICPIETPESEMIGISLQLARHARVTANGEIVMAEGAMEQHGGAMGSVGWGVSMIPFAQHNDDARNMLGAKNLRQATLVSGRCAPLVKTGAERELVEKMCRLTDIGICPNTIDEKGDLALGCDLLVAYMSWNGWNVDDAIVVSRKVAEKMAIAERKWFSHEISPEWVPFWKRIDNCTPLKQGDVVISFANGDKKKLVLRYEDPNPARISKGPFFPPNEGCEDSEALQELSQRLSFELEKEVPLGLGDKLMGRHGNKGVVARVLDEEEMPHLPDDPRLPANLRGKAIDVLLNPHGVLSRMNPGQLLETHLGWLLHAGWNGANFLKSGGVSPELGCFDNANLDHDAIRHALEASGLDRKGCIQLVLPDGSKTESPVLVGFEYFVRLHHVPEFKAQARCGGSDAKYSSTTRQAAHGRRIGGGQRLGEMEVWALAAYGVPHILEEMLGAKSDVEWASEWKAEGAPPVKELFSGFPRVARDWLWALGIDMEQAGADKVRFSLMSEETIREWIEDNGAQRVLSAGGVSKEPTASFVCPKGCGMPFGNEKLPKGSGDNKNTNALRVKSVLRSWGYDCTKPIHPMPGQGMGPAVFEWDLTPVEGAPKCTLVVTLKDYDPQKDWIKAEIVPKPGMQPPKWPVGMETMTCYGRFSKGKVAGKPLNRSAKDLLSSLCGEKEGPALGDFSVTCPHHATISLKATPPYGCYYKANPGSIFDEVIFGDWRKPELCDDKWGYVKLPEPVDYPYDAFGISAKDLRSLGQELPKLTIIPVLPIRYRRPIPEISDNAASCAEINNLYRKLVRACGVKDKEKCLAGVKTAVKELFVEIANRLDKKDGLLRREGLGRRVDRSFRLVITPNPELEWDKVRVPTDVLWELMGDRVLASFMGAETSNPADSETVVSGSNDSEIVLRVGWWWNKAASSLTDDEKYKLLRDYLNEHPQLILLNRQPTLHRHGFQAFYPEPLKPEDGEVLQISPLCCKGFAADFDGDEMVGHYPVSDEAQKEAVVMLPRNNLRMIGTGKASAQYDRDFVTGLQIVYENQVKYKKEIDEINLDDGIRKLFEEKFDKPGEFGKKLIDELSEENGEKSAKAIAALARLAYHACTRQGVSFGFYDLLDLSSRVGKMEEQGILDKVRGASDLSAGEKSVLDMVRSGANGQSQIRQLIGSRGELHVDMDHLGYSKDLIPDKAKKFDCSLVHGMSWDEMFWSSLNARTTMCNKKLGAGKAGDLTRRLVFMLWPKGQEGLIAAQAIGERGLQVAMQGFHTGGKGIDIARSRALFLTGEVGEKGSPEHRDYVRDDDKVGFINAIRKNGDNEETEYAEIDDKYLEILWEALKKKREATKNSAAADKSADKTFTDILFQRQKRQIFELAISDGVLSFDSPFAKVMFNRWGHREKTCGKEDA